MKPFNLKRIIGTVSGLALLILLGNCTQLTAQITIKYPSRPPANGGFACVGDTILVTATDANIADLTIPKGSHWSGDAGNTVVEQTANSITKRFFTYHPYQEADPTIGSTRNFDFTIRLKDGSTKTVSQAIVAKSCPPREQQAPQSTVTVTSFGDKYNLGNIKFEYVFDNETSDEAQIRITPAFNPDQPFCLLDASRSNQNQWKANYRALQTSDAEYDIAIRYNEGDSIRNVIFRYDKIALTQPLGTLEPDATSYCAGSPIVFSLQLGTDWQKIMNQTVNNDESKTGSCFDWSGSPAPVSFLRREGDKYLFSTTAAGTSTGDYRCTMSLLFKYANTKNSPKIDTSFTVQYDVPVKNVQYAQAKGFKKHDTIICQTRPINLTEEIEAGATVIQYRTKSGTPITQFANYKPNQSDVVYADISSPCPWTDTLRVNVIDGDKFLSFSPTPDKLLICAGDTVSFSASANSSPIGWTIMVPTNTDANDTWDDTENGIVHKRAFSNDAIVTATLSQCNTVYKQFRVQVVQRPAVKLGADAHGCPYTTVNLSGTGGSNPTYSLYDLRNKTDLTATMNAYLTSAAGLKNYPLRPNDSLRLVYTAGNQGTASGYTPSSLTCTASDTALVIAYPTPSVRMLYQGTYYDDGGTACVPREEGFTLTATGADTYAWLDDATVSGAARNLVLAKDSLLRVRGENSHHCFDTCAVRCVVSVEKADRVKTAADCPGEEICFEADGLPSTTYAWYAPDDSPLDVTTPKLCRAFKAGQDGTYTLRTQRLGCSESLPYTLTLYPAPDIKAQSNSPLCVGEELVINYRTGLPDTELSYINFTQDGEPKDIQHGNGDLLIYQQPDVQLSDAGQYILKVTTHNDCVASDTVDVVVEEPAVVRIVMEKDTVCEDEQTRLKADIATPSDNYRYEWYNANRLIYDADESEIEVRWMREDNGALHLTVHQHACKSQADTSVAVIPTPQLSGMPQDTGICQGQSICLNPVSDIVPEAIRWFWINDDHKIIPLSQQTSLPYCLAETDESMNGQYFVLVTHIVGNARCVKRSDTTRLTVNKIPDIRIAGPDYICDQTTVMLRAISNTPGTVRWHHDNSTDDIIHVSDPGRYAVTRISEAGGCQDSAEHYLVARALPYFSLPPDTSICRGSWTMIYGPDGMDAYLWNDGSQDKDHIAEAAGLYVLTVSRNGCSFSDSTRIDMTFCGQFHFPTAFSPNDNRVNDSWGAISSAKDEDMAEFDLMVFDRNGKKVFHGKRISEQWDGRYKGELCPPGIYMYSFKALEKLDGIKYQTNGTVTIVR